MASPGFRGWQVSGGTGHRTGESSARRRVVFLKKGPVIGDGLQLIPVTSARC
jgi:hypothetical protein